jgi:hypothetical protein
MKLRDRPFVGRVAGNRVGELRGVAADNRFVEETALGGLEGGAPSSFADLLRTEGAQLFEPREARLRAGKILGGLNGLRIAGAPAVLVEEEAAGHVLFDGAAAVLFSRMAVEETMREADEVSGEAVTADVRRLPDRLTVILGEMFVECVAVLGAALIAFAVRADEEERLAQDPTARGRAAGGDSREVQVR